MRELTYLLGEYIIGGVPVKIRKEEYESYLKASCRLDMLFDLENSFNLFALALIDFEIYILQVATQYQLGGHGLERDRYFDEIRANLNLKLISTLNTSRAYEELSRRHLSSILLQVDGVAVDAAKLFNVAFDSSLEYRVIYKLRNYAAHQSLPIGMISLGSTRQCETESDKFQESIPIRRRYTVQIGIPVSKLLESSKINEVIKKELRIIESSDLDLKYFLRGFAQNFARVHQRIREITEGILDSNLKELEDAAIRVKREDGADPIHASILTQNDRAVIDEHNISLEYYRRLKDKRQRWYGIRSIQTAFVSSEIVANKNFSISEKPSIWIPK